MRVAQGGVALGLVLSMSAVVVTADGDEQAPAALVVDSALAQAAAGTDTAAEHAEALETAQAAVQEVSRVRSDATQAAVPAEVLAELDAATAALQEAIAQADVEPVVERRPNVSRDADRAADPTATPETTTSAAATPGSAATPGAEIAGTRPAADATPTPAATTGTGTADALTDAPLPDGTDPVTSPLRAALDRVRVAAQAVVTTTEQKLAEQSAAQIASDAAAATAARQAAEEAAAQAAQRASWKASLRGYENGQVPSSALCGVSFDAAALLRCDAAEALDALDAAFAARFGTHLSVSDSYRSYSAQVACRAAKGSLCATPGTSNHGMGVAVDLGGSVQSFGTAQHQWMRENAPAFQWTLPEWARATGSKPEPWHWEYTG